MPKATICDACHVERSPRKCGPAREEPIFLENCYEVIDYVEFSKTGVLAESVRKNTERALRPDKQKQAF